MEQVQFAIIQVLDGITQIFWQDVPLRFGFGCRICSGLLWRRSVSDRIHREEVGQNLLTAFASHDMNMAL
jgi:hypothetical protein